MCKSILSISFLVASLFPVVASGAATPDLASIDWSVNATHNLATNLPSDDVINAFMTRVIGVRGYPTGICYARFANLENSGQLSLVVAVSDSTGCGLAVVDKTPSSFRVYSFDLFSHYAQSPEIRDLRGNGQLELVVPTDVTGDHGADYCGVQWPAIYAWTGDGYDDVSGQYRSYYAQQLATLKRQIAATEAEKRQAQKEAAGLTQHCQDRVATVGKRTDLVPPAPPGDGVGVDAAETGVPQFCWPTQSESTLEPESDWSGLNCLKAEAAKMERFLEISRNAGLLDAIRWAKSIKPEERMFASDILANIGTPQAMNYLKKLSHDPNGAVATGAKIWLTEIQQGPIAQTVDERTVPLSVLTEPRK